MKKFFKRREFKIWWRWSLIGMLLITGFWGIWSIFASVPVVNEITFYSEHICSLPIEISRWWDAFVVPFWMIVVALLFFWIKKNEEEEVSNKNSTVTFKDVIFITLYTVFFLCGASFSIVLFSSNGLIGAALPILVSAVGILIVLCFDYFLESKFFKKAINFLGFEKASKCLKCSLRTLAESRAFLKAKCGLEVFTSWLSGDV